ncbi:type I methionyl aminopeptidase [Patescibacteria group bacterium]
MKPYSQKEIDLLREGGKRLANILHTVAREVRPGVTTKELDTLAEKLIRDGGDEPAFLNYKPEGASRPYPASLCVSVNNEIVHGLPGDRVLEQGDIVGLDLGLTHGGLVTDSAITVPVGNISKEKQWLSDATLGALHAGIDAARAGNTIGDIGHAIEEFIKPYGYGLIEELGGHGVGRKVHEEPFIANYGKKGTGMKLMPGVVIALEPMFTLGGKDVILAKDGFTFKTADRSTSAHFEHTILITDDEPEILTQLQ